MKRMEKRNFLIYLRDEIYFGCFVGRKKKEKQKEALKRYFIFKV